MSLKTLKRASRSIQSVSASVRGIFTHSARLIYGMQVYRGKPIDHKFIIALVWNRTTQLELIQPLVGTNIYTEFLDRRGDGLHHIKEWVDDCQKELEEYPEAWHRCNSEWQVRRGRTLLSGYRVYLRLRLRNWQQWQDSAAGTSFGLTD